MTKQQIGTILNDLGYDFNEKIKMPEVSSIYLITDNSLYPSEDTRLMFTDENNSDLLLIFRGYERNDEFIQYKNYPDEIVSFRAIAGFILTGRTHMAEPFKISKAV